MPCGVAWGYFGEGYNNVPKNRPAIGNLMTMFDFSHPHFGTITLPVHQQPRLPGRESR